MRIVLLGGGIGHISFIRNFAQKLPTSAEVVLVHTEPQVFYEPSFYAVLNKNMPVHDGFVDLRNLCTLMGVTFIQAEVEDVQLEDKIVRLKHRAGIQYDYLSLSGLELPNRLDAGEENKAVVHINDSGSFFAKLKETHELLKKTRPSKFQIAIVGGGGDGVQVAKQSVNRFKPLAHKLCIEIFEKKDKLLSRFPSSIRKHVEAELRSQDILFHTEFDVQAVDALLLKEDKKNGRSFKADLVILANGYVMPKWIDKMSFIRSSEGYLETHKTGVLLSVPNISAEGWIAGTASDEERAHAYALSLYARATGDTKKHVEIPKHNKKMDAFASADELLTVQWGVLRKSQKQFSENIQLMKATLEHLRAVKEQKRTQLDPNFEDSGLIENLKRRLQLDIEHDKIEELFSESIGAGCQVNTWLEKEYKDVFNDHFQSAYYACLDLLEKSYLKQAVPQYLRLQVAAPVQMKDVEILSQIIIGAVNAAGNRIPIRLHICGQSMNTVQMTLGMLMEERTKYRPENRAYIALARPLGLYGLLSQQANSESVGQWMSAAREQLGKSLESLLTLPEKYKNYFSAFPVSEWGLMNDLTGYVGHDGWRVCVNLSQLPRWEGVDHIMKQNPNDTLIERNWRKGFKFWPGHGETLPESQYLLWEPHVLRPSACFVIDPSIAQELDRELMNRHGLALQFVGYVEAVHNREQTHYKLSDWQLEATSEENFVGVEL